MWELKKNFCWKFCDNIITKKSLYRIFWDNHRQTFCSYHRKFYKNGNSVINIKQISNGNFETIEFYVKFCDNLCKILW